MPRIIETTTTFNNMASLTYVPASVSAGTSLELTRTFLFANPASGWTYTFYLRAPGFTAIQATAVGDSFYLLIPASATATLKTGTYQYSERLTNGSLVQDASRGTITILADTATLALGDDGRTHAQRTLDIIEAALENRLVEGIQQYTIAGRAISKIPLTELAKLRDVYKLKVIMEKRASSNKFSINTAYVTFKD